MDVKDAASKARNCITNLFAGEGIANLGLDEAVYEADSGQWRVAFSFARTKDGQGNMGLKAPGAYQAVLQVDDSNCRVVALTVRSLPEMKPKNPCLAQPHAAGASNDGSSVRTARARNVWRSWRDWQYSPVSLFKVFLLYPGSGAGAATALTTWIPQLADKDGVLASCDCIVGFIVGMIAEGRAWQNRP